MSKKTDKIEEILAKFLGVHLETITKLRAIENNIDDDGKLGYLIELLEEQECRIMDIVNRNGEQQ